MSSMTILCDSPMPSVPRVGRDHGGADLDTGNVAAGYREGGERVESEDVGHPHRREPVVGRLPQVVAQLAERLRTFRLR
jgi:hypothetical protein